MDAAADVFLAVGFEEASIEAIAARAGVTKVTLYKRFPDKRSLLRAVLQQPPASADLEKRLKYYAATILVRGISAEVRAFHDLVASAWPSPDDMATREDVLGYNHMLQCLRDEIRSAGHNLGVTSANSSAVATALMAMLSGWFEHRPPSTANEKAHATKFAHKAVELLIHGKAAW